MEMVGIMVGVDIGMRWEEVVSIKGLHRWKGELRMDKFGRQRAYNFIPHRRDEAKPTRQYYIYSPILQ